MGENHCSIDKDCAYYRAGAGGTECYQCEEMRRKAAQHDQAAEFYTDQELIDQAADNGKIVSIFTALRHVDHDKRAVFEDHYLCGVSLQEIADEHGISKQSAYRAIRSVRHDVKKIMGLSTVF